MRLGEIKNKIDPALNDARQISIEREQIYGGQVVSVKNYSEVINAIKLLMGQEWNDADGTQIQDFTDDNKLSKQKQLSMADFNRLNTYVAKVNQKLPFYYAILEIMVEEQEEQTINLKLPDKLDTFANLTNQNQRLDKLFKEFQVDGDFRFKGFDVGTAWYVVLVVGVLSYRLFIACLKVAQEYLKMKTAYFESKKTKVEYRAALATINPKKEYDATGLKEYVDQKLKIEIENGVKNAIEAVGSTNGATEKELHAKLIKATTNLIAELESGVEFHLSFSPPSYAQEQNGVLEINYKALKQEEASPQQLTAGKQEIKSN